MRLSNETVLKCLPVAHLTGKPPVWLTQKDAILAIRNAETALLDLLASPPPDGETDPVRLWAEIHRLRAAAR